MLRQIDERAFTDFSHRWQHWNSGMHSNDYVFSEDTIAFVHLPKTGGTSFGELLSGSNSVSFAGLGIHRPVSRSCPPSTHRYFTVMRHPVERVWSYYQMALRSRGRGGWGIYGHVAGRGLEFFLSRCWEVRNMACRYYSGDVRREPDTRSLEVARGNLGKFEAVLSFENLGNDAAVFFCSLGQPAGPLPHANTARYDLPRDDESALIAAFNQLDLSLYRDWCAVREKSKA